ncbi:PAAR domain-containing protein [Paraburkholderia diazotrophica]|uniref:PAAR domain-containing protein n=1 Tax=Paraburkholderia diazotrophica TaxID=667676 RepID=UPI000B859A1C|nr:PAAR domain-containing protein [Paraburkholderia diazotrophica]
MKQRFEIRDGDITTANGRVFAASRVDMLDGRAIAYEGDIVSCPACGTQGRIVCDGNGPRETGQGNKRTALSDDLCVCQCEPFPRLIASQRRSFCR